MARHLSQRGHRGLSMQGKQCTNCVHVWRRNGSPLDALHCGKECVRQSTCEQARAVDGDCGPEARHYMESIYDD